MRAFGIAFSRDWSAVAAYGAVADGPAFVFPQVARFGGIVAHSRTRPNRRGAGRRSSSTSLPTANPTR